MRPRGSGDELAFCVRAGSDWDVSWADMDWRAAIQHGLKRLVRAKDLR